MYYRNRFVTQYITYLNIWEALLGTFSPLSVHRSWVDNGDKVPESASHMLKWHRFRWDSYGGDMASEGQPAVVHGTDFAAGSVA